MKLGTIHLRRALNDKILDARTVCLIGVAFDTCISDFEGLKRSCELCDQHGISLADRKESALVALVFCGFSRAISAIQLIVEHAKAEGIANESSVENQDYEARKARGRENVLAIYRTETETMIEMLEQLHPDLADSAVADAYGRYMSRPFIDRKTTELIAVALLASFGSARMLGYLTGHIRGALRVGASPDELKATLDMMKNAISINIYADNVVYTEAIAFLEELTGEM